MKPRDALVFVNFTPRHQAAPKLGPAMLRGRVVETDIGPDAPVLVVVDLTPAEEEVIRLYLGGKQVPP